MTLQQLQYLVALAESNSINQAAQNLFVSQSGISKAIKQLESELGFPLLEISAATRQGVDALVRAVWQALAALPPVTVYEDEMVIDDVPALRERDVSIEVRDGVYFVVGQWPERIIQSVNFGDYESRMYFERVLRKAGVFDMLEKAGVQEGDTVDVCGCQFEYVF